MSIPGIKACLKDAFTQQELMDAFVIHFGVVTVWDKIFTIAPGTENNYLPSLRNANKRLFLYQTMVLLQDNEAMRHFIVNHTEQNTTVAQWKEAIKTSFGLTYYNDMMVEVLAQYVTQYWVHELQEQYMYGSSRLGSVQRNLPLVQQVLNSDSLLYHDYSQDSIRYFYRGQKRYELSNHLGNVLAVISDRKIEHCDAGDLSYYVAQVVSVTDYYAFGMEIKERSWSVSSYRYGFNGKEKDSEGMGGGGATYDYGFRIYNPQLGKFLSVDPLTSSFPSLTPYQFASNMPIVAIDLDGLEAEIFHNHYTSTSLGRSLFKIVNKTRLAKQFQEVLKSQNKFDVYYVPFTSKYSDAEGIVHDGLGHNPDGTIDDFGGARGYTFTFKSLDDAKKQIARNYALHNVLIEDLEKSFEDGKEVIVVVIADVFTDGKSIFDKNKTTIDNAFTMLKSLKEGAETVLHEQTAHVINRLKGIEKTTKEEHGDYHGDKTITSPTIEDIETKGKYKNTTAREAVNQINEVIDEMEAKLESKR